MGALGDELGLDYFDSSSLIAYAIECFERGILTEKDTDGLRLDWGNQDTLPKLLSMIARREGFGGILAEGLERAPRMIGKGSEKYAMQDRGMTFAGRDPRSSKGWGLMYAVSSRGPVTSGLSFRSRCRTTDGMCRWTRYSKNTKTRRIVFWRKGSRSWFIGTRTSSPSKIPLRSASLRSDPWMFSPTAKPFSIPGMLARFYNATTGSDISEEELLHTGERIVNVERAFNVREGLTRKDDRLPERMLNEPMPDGFAKGQVVHLEPMLDEYYAHRQWDQASGLPTRRKLEELKLDDIATELEALGKLAK